KRERVFCATSSATGEAGEDLFEVPQNTRSSLTKMKAAPDPGQPPYMRENKENTNSLLHVSQCCEILLAGPDLDHTIDVVNEDLAVADVTCVECFLGCIDDLIYRDR
ncbi:hypothetical protein SAMN02910456_02676, partial [Ruminococcaceae bacterium YRB3002]